MIWLLLAWAVVAVWLGIALGRLLRGPRNDDAAANRSRMQVVRSEPEAFSPGFDHGAPRPDEVAEIHRLLVTLNKLDPKLAKTATLRWIGGLSKPAIATTLRTTVDAVEQDLLLAKFLLRKAVRARPHDAG
ncbi:MAG TPA: ECF-type sigma factor [Planctomycetota bacterium]